MDHTHPAKRHLSDDEWDQAVDLYELGIMHGCEIAERFGVSPQAISKGLKKRSAVKGRRARETVADLERDLALKRLRQLQADRVRWDEAMRRDAIVETMMRRLVAADREGKLASMGSMLEWYRRAL